jgi:hypothetical protein
MKALLLTFVVSIVASTSYAGSAVGVYQGIYNNADVYLNVNLDKENRVPMDTPSAVPSPRLVGSIIFSPKISVSIDSRPLQAKFLFDDGQYDSPTGLFSFTLERLESSESFNCRADGANLDCIWSSSSGNKYVIFKKTTADALKTLTVKSTSDFVYAGSDNEVSLNIQFGTHETQSDTPSIFGNLTWFDPASGKLLPGPTDPQVRYSFNNGFYDPTQGIVAGSIVDDHSTININCLILDQDNLECKWYALVDHKISVRKTVKP